jgi:benzylsuccinate CoA-transferase BbsE subunit
LGADVIKIERPGGDPARNLGPFYHDDPNPEKSLFWFAYNSSKRGITLNIVSADGQYVFRQLVKTADIIVESFSPGYLDQIGLGYSSLQKINPRIILVSISPFGQTGPYMDYKAPDIVAWAMGGEMAPFGDADRPPVRIGHHSQAHLLAGADGATGALLALYDRDNTGEGQQVDISIQEAVINCTEHITSAWDLSRQNRQRGLTNLGHGGRLTNLWPCKDGFVAWFFWFGAMSVRTNVPLVRWMEKEGMADKFMSQFDWPNFNEHTTQDDIDRIEAQTARFFLSHTKAELYSGALKNNVQVYPVSDSADMLADLQLAARKFWVDVEHPELGTSLPYPGPFAQSTEVSPRISRRAPLIGEHNQEIYEEELAISREELIMLKQAGVI